MSPAGVTPSVQSHLWQAHLGLLQMAVVHSSERDYDGILKCHGQNGRSSTQNGMIIIIIIITGQNWPAARKAWRAGYFLVIWVWKSM